MTPSLLRRSFGAATAAGLALAGCGGPQSALAPAGRDAERIATLFWWMAGGAAVVWGIVLGVALYAVLARVEHERARTRLVIVVGGAVFPTVVLGFLLVLGLRLLPDLLAPGSPGGPVVHVTGERWWWRVRYEMPDGGSFELANEIRLPVGERVDLRLETADVIHALWVPSLGGKIDMIPGRVNRMALEPTRTGVFRGACAEYCGTSHAHMGLHAVVLEPEAFAAWVAAERAPADPPAGPLAQRGGRLFAELGCGACHAVRGTAAAGTVGPDLTHVGRRVALAAGVLENDAAAMRRWLVHTRSVKPGANMPAFDMLADDELDALAAYLEGLG